MATMIEIKATLESKAQEYNGLLLEKKYDKIPAVTQKMDELVQDMPKRQKKNSWRPARPPRILSLTR